MTPERWNRIQWRCRRGMLENDLILTRFLDAEGERLDEADQSMLMRLLELPDNELWDLLSGRKDPDDHTLVPLLQRLRNC